jgi:hypothetical protein
VEDDAMRTEQCGIDYPYNECNQSDVTSVPWLYHQSLNDGIGSNRP